MASEPIESTHQAPNASWAAIRVCLDSGTKRSEIAHGVANVLRWILRMQQGSLMLTAILTANLAAGANNSGAPKPIDTDRPDVTPYTVPKGSLQVENGIAWTGDELSRAVDLTESLLRIGVTDSTEFRLGVPTYFHNLGRFTEGSGFDDLSIGAKQRVGSFAGFDLAIVPAISFPIGSGVRSSHSFDPDFEIPWQRDLSQGWDLSGTLGVFYLTDDRKRKTQGENQVELEWQVGSRTDVFFEYQSFFGQGLANNSLQIGGGYRLRPTQRLDYFVVVGLSRAAPNIAVGVGFSFRADRVFQRLLR